jgi:hypothetical protein
MRFWWVSQNQTYRQEVPGGYLWSPKVQKNGDKNHFYETMREISRGDLIFSFYDRKIMAVGIAVARAYTSPKPLEFGLAGLNWQDIGWKVEVKFHQLIKRFEPRKHMNLLEPLLPKTYSPIRADGTGNQMYLAEIGAAMALVIIDIIGPEGKASLQEGEWVCESSIEPLRSAASEELMSQWDAKALEEIELNAEVPETEKKQIIRARRGQGEFRNRVAEIESRCRVTLVTQPEHLIASHIKPWRMADNKERLDGSNGLLLTPDADHLFDEGLISFRGNGAMLVSPVVSKQALRQMGIPTESDASNVGTFSKEQQVYLEFHRDMLFHQAAK